MEAKGLRRLKNHSGLKYLMVGGGAFLTEYSLFYLLYRGFHFGIFTANSLSFIAGLIFSFTLNRGWTFKGGGIQKKVHHQLLMYGLLATFNLLASNVLIGGLRAVGVDPRVGKILAIGTIAVWNYTFFSRIIFKSK